MNIINTAPARRTKLSLPYGGGRNHMGRSEARSNPTLPVNELRRLVAEMVG